jgi:hypothetical protein
MATRELVGVAGGSAKERADTQLDLGPTSASLLARFGYAELAIDRSVSKQAASKKDELARRKGSSVLLAAGGSLPTRLSEHKLHGERLSSPRR